VQVILPDLRYNRTAMMPAEYPGGYEAWARKRAATGLPLPGPYVRNPDPKATMLGERQWQWLEHQLEVPAELRLFGSSVQVLADFTGWEAWANFARDQDRLFDVIRRKRANGVVFLSGDIHYAELSKREVNVPYPLWDLTSSGLTEEWRVPTPNANRASEVVADANFGTIDIDWQGDATQIRLGIVDAAGRTRLSWTLPLADLVVRA
jgi:alkaline phosphatase D